MCGVGLFAIAHDELGLYLALFLFGLPVYFLPALVASYRGHRNLLGVLLLNLFLGWTLVGWVGALIWAVLTEQGGPRYGRRPYPGADDDEPNPFAAPAPVPVAATRNYVCPTCRATVPVPVALVGRVVACGACGVGFVPAPVPRPR